ncbi:MAG: hypothetical protein COT84_03370 [Chlamydiae bacterium CG10_big_fil_rev_8_21_14_0_10_35_9]|nr:MAG: hypothetical protein COT84_03370 [Chlamydiae bacterium CG10_big_fil_rev_8_21_14_0_10_35_9]
MKKIIWVIVSLIIFVVLVFFSLPTIASTNFGKKIIVRVLSKKLNGNLSVGSWSLSWSGPQSMQNVTFKGKQLDFSFSSFEADLSFWSFFTFSNMEKHLLKSLDGKAELRNGSFLLRSDNAAPASFENLNATMTGSDGKDIDLSLTGITKAEGIIGQINVEAKISSVEEIYSSLPEFIKVELANFPTIGLDRWVHGLKFKGKNQLLTTIKKDPHFFEKLLGPLLNLKTTFLSKGKVGNLRMYVNATNGHTSIDADIENKVLYLNESILATFQLTPTLSTYLMKDANPLFITAVEARHPITLEIDKNGFECPLDPFSIKTMSIEKATLDMGKITCKNGGTLALIIGIMKLHNLQRVHEMTVWFTPVNIQIHNGVAFTDRMDALVAEDIHICTWGNINLENKRLDMTLGITADSLNRSFGIKGLPSNYVMQVPLTGTTEDPNINTGAVAAKIAALVAADQAAGRIPGLPGVLKALGTTTKERTPPPKRPFPWESEITPNSEDFSPPTEEKEFHPFFEWLDKK